MTAENSERNKKGLQKSVTAAELNTGPESSTEPKISFPVKIMW